MISSMFFAVPMANAEDGTRIPGSDLKYTLIDGTLTIFGEREMPRWAYLASIPWHYYKNRITTVIIQEGVTSIGDHAFRDCDNLTSISIPMGLTTIRPSALANCGKLTSIILPNSIISIGAKAFINCINLISIEIPNGVTYISKSMFAGCSGLESIEIPNSINSIDDYAFNNCTSLETVIYSGTSEQWNDVNISLVGNDNLENAKIICTGDSSVSAEFVKDYTSDTESDSEASLWQLNVMRGSGTVNEVGVKLNVDGVEQSKTIDTGNIDSELIFGIVVNKLSEDISSIDALINGDTHNVYTGE